MTEKQKRLAEMNGTLDKVYGQKVNRLVRRKYSQWDEIAILRQRDEKPDEFAEYNAFVETCKADAKAKVYGVD